jgi:hypothetical protein
MNILNVYYIKSVLSLCALTYKKGLNYFCYDIYEHTLPVVCALVNSHRSRPFFDIFKGRNTLKPSGQK